MVTVDALLATSETLAVTPFGAAVVVVPAQLVYHVTAPPVPEAILAVVTAKVALPSAPPTIAPDCAPLLTAGVPGMTIIRVPTAEGVEL